jgi:NAD(P)-dependent dehydrogenase (short-subunit alcohol dehydrogenase family)
MSRNLAQELGPDGITVNTVHPGMTRAERTPGMLAVQAEPRGISEKGKAGTITGDVTAAGGGVGNAIWYWGAQAHQCV